MLADDIWCVSHVKVEATRLGDSNLMSGAWVLTHDNLFKRNLSAVIQMHHGLAFL
jgi:hypothetical protein